MLTGIHSRSIRHSRKGMTLLELTIIIVVSLSLISILFFTAKAWKRSSDRAACIMNIQAVQKAVRGYSNMYGYAPGATVPSLQNQIIGSDAYLTKIPKCPAGGTCACGEHLGADVIPPLGELYLSCSFGTSANHLPPATDDW